LDRLHGRNIHDDRPGDADKTVGFECGHLAGYCTRMRSGDLDAMTKKLTAPVSNSSPDAPQNQIESNPAIEVESFRHAKAEQ